jgi:hypothetical protein
MTEDYKAAILAMTDDEREVVANALAKARYDSICALICSLFTLAGGYGGIDLNFVQGQLARINDAHAREVSGNDTEDRRLIVPREQHYVFEPFKLTRAAWNTSDFDDKHRHLTFYGDFVSAHGAVEDGVILFSARPFSSLFG